MDVIKVYSSDSSDNAPKGSLKNPYTLAEYESLLDAGAWTGGYVVGLGYCFKEATVVGSNPSSSNGYGSYGSSGSWSYESGGSLNLGGSLEKNDRGINNGRTFDISKATTYIINNSTPTYIKGENGHCAKTVREALEAGGLLTTGRPNSAYQYAEYLPMIGFRQIPYDSSYVPRAGDIAVMPALSGHPHGHISMFTGTQWVSDFKQSDMWGGSAYRQNGKCVIFRW